MQNKVQLITYVDRLSGGGLRELRELLDGPLADLFGGVHLLPFFDPIDGADAGFDPIDHTRIDPRLGNWGDLQRLGDGVEIMADLIVNHMSADSAQFADFVEKGAESDFNGLFLTFSSVFPEGATEEALMQIYRPRPGLPFTYRTLADGRKILLWTTFTSNQLDIDVASRPGREYLTRILDTFESAGVRAIRLDAAGYAIKKAGTNCFMIPETFEFIGALADDAKARGIDVLVEIHSHYKRQIEIAARVGRVYDFALPPLVLHALKDKTSRYLKAWLEISPRNAVTVLDTHDGIGVIDVGADSAKQLGDGLLPPADINALVEWIHSNSGGESRKATGAAASNLDLYQVNCTYFDALGRNEADYLRARAIQFFAPGIPQVYYVGLLAGQNDMSLLAETQVGRDINRHYYALGEVAAAIETPVVRDLFRLIRFRNEHPAFGGEFHLPACRETQFKARWTNGSDWAELCLDLVTGQAEIHHGSASASHVLPLFDAICSPEGPRQCA